MRRKYWWIILVVILISGCAKEKTRMVSIDSVSIEGEFVKDLGHPFTGHATTSAGHALMRKTGFTDLNHNHYGKPVLRIQK